MGIWRRLKQTVPIFRMTPTDAGEVAERLGASYFIPLFTSARTFDDNKLLKDFEEIPEFNYLVNLKARMKSRMVFEVVNIKTGEPVPDDPVAVLLSQPNWFQTGQEFNEQGSILSDIFGNEYVYGDFPYGFTWEDAKYLYTLPGHLIEAKCEDDRPFYMTGEPKITYLFTWDGKKYPISQDQIMHMNTNRVNMTRQNWVTGESVFVSCKPCLNNIRAAYEARGIIIDNRGAEGVLKNPLGNTGSLPLNEDAKKDIEARLRHYGDRRGQSRVIVTNQDLQWVPMGKSSPEQLGLYKEVEQDAYKLCDAAGVDPDLMGQARGATFENKKQAERRTYENTIIPESIKRLDAFNSMFSLKKRGRVLVGRFDHLSVFAEDNKLKAEALTLVTGALAQALADQAISIEQYQAELEAYGIERAMA